MIVIVVGLFRSAVYNRKLIKISATYYMVFR